MIPARGQSKTIPHKNLYPLNGVPLIAYTILAAKASRVDDFVVSTDDDMIREVAEQYGAKVIRRPAELGQDDTPMVPVVQHAVAEYERDGDYVDAVCLLQPTSPLRTAEDIDQCLRDWREFGLYGDFGDGFLSLVSVCRGAHPMKSYHPDGIPIMAIRGPYDKRRHECYTRNGAVFITNRALLDAGRLYDSVPLLAVMPKTRSIDIDDMEDMAIAEALLRAQNKACPFEKWVEQMEQAAKQPPKPRKWEAQIEPCTAKEGVSS